MLRGPLTHCGIGRRWRSLLLLLLLLIIIIIIVAQHICGSHALSCRRNPGRSQCHHFMNDLIWRSLSKARFRPPIKEPQGLLRSDGQRPDGLTLISVARWTLCHLGRNSHRYRCRLILEYDIFLRRVGSRRSGHMERGKLFRNLGQLSFFPLAFETFGLINQVGEDFLSSYIGPSSFSCFR